MENEPKPKRTRRYAILLIVNSVLCFALYKTLIFYAERTDETFYSFVVMILYMALLLGFLLAYFIYNRFLYRKNLTPDQLPDTMSPEEKETFIADGRERLEKSRWMMLIIFPLVLTFLFDAVDLFILDQFR